MPFQKSCNILSVLLLVIVFVAAAELRADLHPGIFPHWTSKLLRTERIPAVTALAVAGTHRLIDEAVIDRSRINIAFAGVSHHLNLRPMDESAYIIACLRFCY
jgi:hypothetical protein